MSNSAFSQPSRNEGRQNNISIIIGALFAVAAIGSDYQKSGLSLPRYVGKKVDTAVAAVTPSAAATPAVK